MEIWLKDEKTSIECGINKDGELFLGDKDSGYNLPDTVNNREKVIEDFCKNTGRQRPVIAANGKPLKYDGGMIRFSR